MRKLSNIIKSKFIVIFICLLLFILPFFWLKPGELELGGDSSRLYLYDPWAFLQSESLYSIQPEGLGHLRPDQDFLPFLLFLQLINLIFHSPFILICVLNSIKLVGSFLFLYLIVFEILKKHVLGSKNKVIIAELAGILSGLFYTFSPSVGKTMQVALITHNEVFLNPMIVYFMLKFLVSQKSKYMWLLLLTTVIFAPNFSLKNGIIAVVSFYPLAFAFLFVYVRFYLKKSIPWKKLLLGILLFLGIHAFHIIPTILYVFDPGSLYNTRVFSSESIQNEGLNYFRAILPYAMVTKSLFYQYSVQWPVFIAPLIIILGFFVNHKKQKDLFLISVFFLLATFLESANITQIGNELYGMLFYIPGFSMFRNFYGQWQWVQSFFFSLLFGYAVFLVFSKLKKRIVYVLSIIIVTMFIYSSLPFLSGHILRQPHRATKDVSMVIEMDPHYEKLLAFLKNNHKDGKVFDFPFTEFSYQVVPGLNRGAYISPSPIAYLTGRRDFSGQQILYPFSDVFLSLMKEKNYNAIKRLFALLNIRYIFYNTDPRAYEEFFPELPYTLLLKIFPDSKSLANFVQKIVGEKVFQSGSYSIYSSDKDYYLPHFYVPTTIIAYGKKNDWMGENASFFVETKEADPRVGYLKKDVCDRIYPSGCAINKVKKTGNIPSIRYMRINRTKYKIVVSNASHPFFLIFSDQFHRDWNLFISNKMPEKQKTQSIFFSGQVQESYHHDIFLNDKTFETLTLRNLPETQHIMVNGYANGWYITPKDLDGKKQIELIVEMTQQKAVYYGLGVSLVSYGIFFLWGGILLIKKSK